MAQKRKIVSNAEGPNTKRSTNSKKMRGAATPPTVPSTEPALPTAAPLEVEPPNITGTLDTPQPALDSRRSFQETVGILHKEGDDLLQSLRTRLEREQQGDKLLTKEEIYERYKRKRWCPDSPGAVDEALRRLNLAPTRKGGKGRGKAAQWWASDVEKALKDRKKRHRD